MSRRLSLSVLCFGLSLFVSDGIYAEDAYRRADWLPRWADDDGDCQSTRHEVLIAQSLTVVQLSKDGCKVLAGTWRCPYTGKVLTDPTTIQIDHVIPLAHAHRAGGAAWSKKQKRAFANDRYTGGALLAVAGPVNQSKSDKSLAEWRPPNRAVWPEYAVAWLYLKYKYKLAISRAELQAAAEMLTAGGLSE